MRYLASRIRAFRDDQTGGITILMLVFFIGIVVATGIGLDLANHDAKRADLQSALDRGVLAAASLRQTMDEDEVENLVKEYAADRHISDKEVQLAVTSDISLNARDVRVDGSFDMETDFLRLLGVDTLKVQASSQAAQRASEVEISLVLDISGSMRFGERILELIPAAKDFVRTVSQEGALKRTTINLVRYAGQTNPGPWMFERLGGVGGSDSGLTWGHDESHCFYMEEGSAGDFSDASLPDDLYREQVPHFHKWTIDDDWMKWGWCPSDEMATMYHVHAYDSGDPDYNGYQMLMDAIDNIRPGQDLGATGNLHDGTGTYNAMKWGVALLNPSSRPMMQQMESAAQSELSTGDVPPNFEDEVLRPRPIGPDWCIETTGDLAAFENGSLTRHSCHTESERDESRETLKVVVLMTDGKITDQWDPRNKTDDDTVADIAVNETNDGGGDGDYKLFDRSDGRDYFYDQCDFAKANGVTVFTIAFRTPHQDEMRKCASSDAHFYCVNDPGCEDNLDNVSQAFRMIATDITKLKLLL